MRLMHLVLRPRFSGAEMLARDLCKIQNIDNEVCFASLDASDDDFKSVLDDLDKNGVGIFVPLEDNGKIGRVAHLGKALRDFRPDVVFAHSQIPMRYAAFLRFSFHGRVVKVIHSASGEKYGILDRFIAPSGTHVIGVNREQLESYSAGSGGRILPHYIPNGIHAELFSEAQPLARPQDKKVVIHVGRICDMKGQLDAIDAIAELQDDKIELWTVGIVEDKSYHDVMLEKARKISGGFKWLGGRSDIPELLATADVVLMPSAFEAHPIAYLEALASGKPVVANDIQAFRSVGVYEGVRFINRENKREFSGAISDALRCGGRYKRELGDFDIGLASQRYVDVASIARYGLV